MARVPSFMKEIDLSLEKLLILSTSHMRYYRVSRLIIGNENLREEASLILHANGETGYKAVAKEVKNGHGIVTRTVIERNK